MRRAASTVSTTTDANEELREAAMAAYSRRLLNENGGD